MNGKHTLLFNPLSAPYHAPAAIRSRRLETRPMKRWLFIFLAVLAVSSAHGDYAAYGGRHEVTTTRGTLRFRHVHNWDSPKLEPLFSNLTHHEHFFSTANDFAFVELRDESKILFRSPSPALTHLWISPDGQFFVGLSDIMIYNPYQLVIWQRDGTLLYREHISGEVAKFSPKQRRDFENRFPKAEQFLAERYFTCGGVTYLDYAIGGMPNEIGDAAFNYLFPFRVRHPYSDDFAESVTNFVEWFDPKHSELSLSRDGNAMTLFVRSPTGKRMRIQLKK